VTAPALPTRLDRWSGTCPIAAGVLILPGMLHADIFETTLARVALDNAVWVPIHLVAVVAVVLTLFGLTGLCGARAERLGRLGAAGFVFAVIGPVMTACVASAEAFLLPVIARDQPEVFDWDGPVTTSWAVRVTTGMALLWLVGLGPARPRAVAVRRSTGRGGADPRRWSRGLHGVRRSAGSRAGTAVDADPRRGLRLGRGGAVDRCHGQAAAARTTSRRGPVKAGRRDQRTARPPGRT
jgi:hypothetical protein